VRGDWSGGGGHGGGAGKGGRSAAAAEDAAGARDGARSWLYRRGARMAKRTQRERMLYLHRP